MIKPLIYLIFALFLTHSSLLSASTSSVTITTDATYRYIESNGIADHQTGNFPNRNNPNAIKEQSYQFKMKLNPNFSNQVTDVGMNYFGVALNGVPFDAATAEYWNNDRSSEWNYDALSGGMNLGIDSNHAHVQPNGAYHYHGIPTGYTSGARVKMIGYAADGFPIYYHSNMTSSYQIKSGSRPSGPKGSYDGTFVNDYEFYKGSGDLDECNGTEIQTDSFPNGTYAYFITKEFPNVPRCWKGTPDSSFRKNGMGGGRMQQRNQGQEGARDSQEDRNQNRTGRPSPPREAIAACSRKSEDSSCSFQSPHGNITGQCRSIAGKLACAPERGSRPPHERF